MLTDQDIQKLAAVLATKEDIKDLREETDALRETVHALTVAVDGLAKAITDLRAEYAAVANKNARHEKWILQLAEKVGLKLED